MASPAPELAPVRPRVRASGADSSRLLEEIVEEHADDSHHGIVWLVGQKGAGKTTALAHLTAVFQGDDRFAFVDDADDLSSDAECREVQLQGEVALVVAARRTRVSTGHPSLLLEPWGIDELVEYLLAEHRSRCSEVMQRLGDDARQSWAPELARVLLDELVTDPNLPDVQSALRSYLRHELPETWQIAAARQLCLAYQLKGNESVQTIPPKAHSLPHHVRRLLRHKPVQLPLAAEQVSSAISSGRSPRVLAGQYSLGLVEAVGEFCRHDGEIRRRLEEILSRRRHSKAHAMAASILHAADVNWRPACKTAAGDFSGAYFSGVDWPEISFTNAHLELAEFFDANLFQARFDKAILVETDFVQADLRSASLRNALAVGADFARAQLQKAALNGAKLEKASLVSADLSEARLQKADLCSADLTGACLRRANLYRAVLVSATLTDVDMTDCNLGFIDARRADLRTAQLDRAFLENALLTGANLEDVCWKDVRFRHARLHGAHLTGSQLPAADFRGADLSATGLGEIEWEFANLRNADLTGATFHMGSSRSGLIDSPIASEGSRTGFYTDDLEELYFKSPEQVRKANLFGTDLRGANITNVDFYLVDLRDAKLEPRQRDQARRSGAILTDED